MSLINDGFFVGTENVAIGISVRFLSVRHVSLNSGRPRTERFAVSAAAAAAVARGTATPTKFEIAPYLASV